MGLRFDRRTLSRAKPSAVVRLARFVGLPLHRKRPCECARCMTHVIEALVRKLDVPETTP